MDERFKLCYVRGPWCYFTTRDVEEQWGDDWNDAPYEHNAGRPYEDWERPDEPRWQIARVAYEGRLETPEENGINSRWTVQMINRGMVPWLMTDRYAVDSIPAVVIVAGTSFPEFVRLVQKVGGTVYMALPVLD